MVKEIKGVKYPQDLYSKTENATLKASAIMLFSQEREEATLQKRALPRDQLLVDWGRRFYRS